jgi:hypothetical protein
MWYVVAYPKEECTMKQLPVQQCPYCGCAQFGVGWQQDQGLITYKRNGIFGCPVEHLICAQCGAIVCSRVPDPRKYPSAQARW